MSGKKQPVDLSSSESEPIADVTSEASLEQSPTSGGKPRSINLCGLWLNTYQDGDGVEHAYLSGSLGHTQIGIFKNSNRKKDSHPTHHLVLSERMPKKKDAVDDTSLMSAVEAKAEAVAGV